MHFGISIIIYMYVCTYKSVSFVALLYWSNDSACLFCVLLILISILGKSLGPCPRAVYSKMKELRQKQIQCAQKWLLAR